MSFDHFVESLDNVPPELERNFTLIAKLDKNTKDLMEKINQCLIDYKKADKKADRIAIKNKSNEYFEKLNSYADDKIELALQTYELIDKNIKRLIELGAPKNQTTDEAGTSNQQALVGFDMPLDPNEPTYCVCNSVSHGDMIACDNKECPIEWFHYSCVGLTVEPKGKWYCANCMTTVKKPKSRSKRQRRY